MFFQFFRVSGIVMYQDILSFRCCVFLYSVSKEEEDVVEGSGGWLWFSIYGR